MNVHCLYTPFQQAWDHGSNTKPEDLSINLRQSVQKNWFLYNLERKPEFQITELNA